MTTPRYTVLRCAADAASIRTARYDGVEHLVVPVVALVGDHVMRPLGSEGPEFVPSEVIAIAPDAWAGRSVVEDHPLLNGQPISANIPEILEAQSFGTVFNARFEDGRLKVDAYINPERAVRAGAKAQEVVRRLRALAAGEEEDLVEVSVGAFVMLEKRAGVAPDGTPYDYIWRAALPDHLAVGLGGSKGACSAEAGCGAPRAASETPEPKRAVLRAAILSQARRPQYTGTETSAWSTPSFSDYVRYLHEGAEGPSSVSQASAALKRSIAAHSLLGDPEGSNLRELAFFPVVNPANGRLNERALRAVISGRGAQVDIPERARTSAQDMARRLLNSEFGAELEVSKMSEDGKTKAGARSAAESENLHMWLAAALEEVESGYDYLWVESFDTEAGTVVYCLRGEDGGVSGTYRRTFTLAGETVTIGAQRTEVRRRVVYEEMKAAPRSSRMNLPAPLVKALEALGFRAGQGEDGHSDIETREAMYQALRAGVAAFVDIAEIYPETRTVIYATRPEEMMMWWRRTYEMDGEGAITLNDDEEQVEIEQSWKPVQARLQFEAGEGKEPPCGCSKANGEGQAAPSQDDQGGRMTNETMKQLVGRLIASKHCRYGEPDRATLEAMSEDRLKALSEALPDDSTEGEQKAAAGEEGKEPQKATAPAEPEKPTPAEKKVAAEQPADAAEPKDDSVRVPKEVFDDMKAASAAWKADQERRKGALVASLKAAQDGFTEPDLKAMSIEALQKLARSLKLDESEPKPDYSGRALSEPASPTDTAPPDAWAAGLAAHRRSLGYFDGKEAN